MSQDSLHQTSGSPSDLSKEVSSLFLATAEMAEGIYGHFLNLFKESFFAPEYSDLLIFLKNLRKLISSF